MPDSDGLHGVCVGCLEGPSKSAELQWPPVHVNVHYVNVTMLLSLFSREIDSNELGSFPVSLSCLCPLLGASETAKREWGGVDPFREA